MSWSRRPNAANEPDPLDNDNPLADHMHPNRPRRATGGDTEPLDSAGTPGIYDQHTVVDNNFTGRSRMRRERQGASPFQTQQITAWVGDPRNSSRLMMVGGAVLLFLLLLGAISVYNRLNRTEPVTDLEEPTSSAPGAGADVELGGEVSPAPDPGGFETLPEQPEPEAPAAEPASAFQVTGTSTEGLFLRPEPNTNNAPITTLPEGTRVEWTGESANDGIREWRRVRSDLGEGWVAADYLQPAP